MVGGEATGGYAERARMQPSRKTREDLACAAGGGAQFQRDAAETSSGASTGADAAVCVELQSRGPNSAARMMARPTKRSQK